MGAHGGESPGGIRKFPRGVRGEAGGGLPTPSPAVDSSVELLAGAAGTLHRVLPALGAWRRAVAPAVPAAETPAFDDDLARAALGWLFVSAGWLLDDALGDDPPPRDPALAGLMPRRRQMLAHRFRVAAGLDTAVLPGLRELAAQLAAATDGAWSRPELPLAPAFRL